MICHTNVLHLSTSLAMVFGSSLNEDTVGSGRLLATVFSPVSSYGLSDFPSPSIVAWLCTGRDGRPLSTHIYIISLAGHS